MAAASAGAGAPPSGSTGRTGQALPDALRQHAEDHQYSEFWTRAVDRIIFWFDPEELRKLDVEKLGGVDGYAPRLDVVRRMLHHFNNKDLAKHGDGGQRKQTLYTLLKGNSVPYRILDAVCREVRMWEVMKLDAKAKRVDALVAHLFTQASCWDTSTCEFCQDLREEAAEGRRLKCDRRDRQPKQPLQQPPLSPQLQQQMEDEKNACSSSGSSSGGSSSSNSSDSSSSSGSSVADDDAAAAGRDEEHGEEAEAASTFPAGAASGRVTASAGGVAAAPAATPAERQGLAASLAAGLAALKQRPPTLPPPSTDTRECASRGGSGGGCSGFGGGDGGSTGGGRDGEWSRPWRGEWGARGGDGGDGGRGDREGRAGGPRYRSGGSWSGSIPEPSRFGREGGHPPLPQQPQQPPPPPPPPRPGGLRSLGKRSRSLSSSSMQPGLLPPPRLDGRPPPPPPEAGQHQQFSVQDSVRPGDCFRLGDWICNSCNNHNYSSRMACNRCKQPKGGGSGGGMGRGKGGPGGGRGGGTAGGSGPFFWP